MGKKIKIVTNWRLKSRILQLALQRLYAHLDYEDISDILCKDIILCTDNDAKIVERSIQDSLSQVGKILKECHND
ncbi:hypothetical protein LCGC14_1938200 [marine sediment metagenome]|uniref:Uncharacterized protein n=1 Tax=marine sediment metagenome TaxID=412755 RepID=A0A0F9HZJ7_9ZZZZ